jgi:hypothetical protein
MAIGKVTIVTANDIGKVKVRQPLQTSVVAPGFDPDLKIYMGDILDVDDSNLQDGYTLIYNATTGKYEAKAIEGLAITNIFGGTF